MILAKPFEKKALYDGHYRTVEGIEDLQDYYLTKASRLNRMEWLSSVGALLVGFDDNGYKVRFNFRLFFTFLILRALRRLQ